MLSSWLLPHSSRTFTAWAPLLLCITSTGPQEHESRGHSPPDPAPKARKSPEPTAQNTQAEEMVLRACQTLALERPHFRRTLAQHVLQQTVLGDDADDDCDLLLGGLLLKRPWGWATLLRLPFTPRGRQA